MRKRILLIIIIVFLSFSTTYPISWLEQSFDWDLTWLSSLFVLVTLCVIWLIISQPKNNETTKFWPLKNRNDRYILLIGLTVAVLFTIVPVYLNINNSAVLLLSPAFGWLIMIFLIYSFGSTKLKNWLFKKN